MLNKLALIIEIRNQQLKLNDTIVIIITFFMLLLQQNINFIYLFNIYGKKLSDKERKEKRV